MDVWLIITLLCAVFAALASFFDNSIVDNYFNNSRPQAQKCFFGPFYAIIAILIFVLYPIFSGPSSFSLSSALFIVLSGAILSLSSIPYYFALKSENTTGTAIFFQLTPIFYLVFGALFLGEKISSLQLLAFFVLLFAPLLIIFSARRRGKKLEYKAAAFILVHLLIFTFSYIFFLLAERNASGTGGEIPMVLAVAFLLSGRAIFDIILILSFKKWRRDFSRIIKKSKRRVLFPLFSSAILWTSEDVMLRIAMILGQVAVVSAVESVVRLLAIFLFGLVFTIIWPKFGREKLDKRTVLVHFVAIIIAIFGILLVENPGLFGG